MTNYEAKKAILNEMVENGYYMDNDRIEEICTDDFYKVRTIESWRQKFYKHINKD